MKKSTETVASNLQSCTTREFLRNATQHLHKETERAWVPGGKFDSREDYLWFLDVLLFVHRIVGLPAAYARNIAEDVDFEYARIGSLSSDVEGEEGRPVIDRKFEYSYSWGVGYVLNGSTAGAPSLLSNVQKNADWPCEYLIEASRYATSGNLRKYYDALNLAEINLGCGRVAV